MQTIPNIYYFDMWKRIENGEINDIMAEEGAYLSKNFCANLCSYQDRIVMVMESKKVMLETSPKTVTYHPVFTVFQLNEEGDSIHIRKHSTLEAAKNDFQSRI